MARYKTTETVFLPAPFSAGAEVTYFGWPKHGLEPIDDEAKQIADYFKRHKDSGELAGSPFRDGKLSLPLIGLPRWQLGPSYRAREEAAPEESRVLMKALGWSVMGENRTTSATFSSDRWPSREIDIVPKNPQAEIVAQFMKDNPEASLNGRAWDPDLHALVRPVEPAAA